MIAKLIVRCALGASILTLAACGTFKSKGKDYLGANSIDPVNLPEGMSSRSLDPLYVIPEVSARDEFGDFYTLREYEVPLPGGVNTESGKTGVKLQALSNQKWVYISASTSQVWPRTQNFLSQNGILVSDSRPSEGIIDSSDVFFKDDPEHKSRFRVYVEKGIHPETTEIHIVHRQFKADAVVPKDINWSGPSDNFEREQELLRGLSEVLASSIGNKSASLLGQNVGGSLKVGFASGANEPTMRMRLPMERALASVSPSVELEGFKAWGESAVYRAFYVDYLPEEEEKGFWKSLFTGDGEHPEKAPHDIRDLLVHLASAKEAKQLFGSESEIEFGEALPKSFGYLVVLRERGEFVDVVIRDARGRYIDKNLAKKMFRILRKNLV